MKGLIFEGFVNYEGPSELLVAVKTDHPKKLYIYDLREIPHGEYRGLQKDVNIKCYEIKAKELVELFQEEVDL